MIRRKEWIKKNMKRKLIFVQLRNEKKCEWMYHWLNKYENNWQIGELISISIDEQLRQMWQK